jgi:hypothetical protein
MSSHIFSSSHFQSLLLPLPSEQPPPPSSHLGI